ncbi:hypothetical protein MNEG_11052 [Monoraphidium neglectum]|uniref:GPR180/TMEM145 transmembrane domain-containing protein n=1 Tax=Monoraphidium neglectum TaxID=145388 RepID=A0A0D2LZS7_9CHLO|nr:hypothetical protein MNEG_11052 [Monoraphidium neglectum]KIY96909.1 hypothetical protein MNEG_11052 [Monoraphidium neglectum]|eukprot:XP_013895929.1 hypothetical protein MNEG_11052 [Monoraphidium neglectum]
MDTPEDPDLDVGWAVTSAAVRCAAWWLLWGGTVALGVRLRGSRSRGWTLYRVLLAVLTAQALKMSAYLAYADSFRRGDAPVTTSRLFLAYIPFREAAQAAFLGLLLLLASGFSITRADMGAHKAKVVGIPAILLVTGVVTGVLYTQFTDAVSDDVDVLSMAPWEQALWFVCTLLNMACLMLAWVYAFDIIAQEMEALDAQEAFNKRSGPADNGAPAAPSGEAAGAAPHAAAANEFDEALGREGVTAYKQLLGAGQNASHIAGADVEAQEFETVADRLNFEIKKNLRFSFGVGAYLIATMCALLLPIYMNVVVQGLVVFLQFLVQLGFMAALVWIFRPVEDSPYLMVGSSLEHAEELGVADLGTALGLDGDGDDDDGDDGRHLRGAVELGAVPHHGAKQEQRQQQQQPKAPPRAPRPAGGSGAPSDAGGSGRRDQSGAGAAPARLPLSSSASDLLQPPPGLPPDVNSTLFRTFLAATGSSHMQSSKRDNKPQARDKQNPPKPLTE